MMTDRSSDAVDPSLHEEPAQQVEVRQEEVAEQAAEGAEQPAEPPPTLIALPESQVRRSRPTPSLETPPEDSADDEDFFDDLGEKLRTVTDRLRRSFRRPDPDEVQIPHVDGHRGTETVDVDLDETFDAEDADAADRGRDAASTGVGPRAFGAAPAERSATGDTGDADYAGGSGYSGCSDADCARTGSARPAPGFWADEVVEEATRADTDPTYRESIIPGLNDPEATESIPVISATTIRNSRISLPEPPSSSASAAPEEPGREADGSGRSASEERRRAVILEKAAAIEAAAEQERREAQELEDASFEDDGSYTYVPPYNLPSRDPEPAPTTFDLIRQAVVTLGFLAAAASVLLMLGAGMFVGDGFETHVEGWYSGQQALLTPSHWFYWFWPVVVVTLLGHTVHQWSTSQISTPRQRRTGWLVATASTLMLVWVLSVRADQLTVATLAALAAALALIDGIRQFTLRTARNSGERRLSDGPVGLFTGFAMVHAMGSISAWLTAHDIRIPGVPATVWALAGLAVCIWLGALYAMTERGRITIALGLGWGMFWLVFPRLLSELQSVTVAIVAAMGAFIIILATQSRRHRINYAERRAAMGRPVDDII